MNNMTKCTLSVYNTCALYLQIGHFTRIIKSNFILYLCSVYCTTGFCQSSLYLVISSGFPENSVLCPLLVLTFLFQKFISLGVIHCYCNILLTPSHLPPTPIKFYLSSCLSQLPLSGHNFFNIRRSVKLESQAFL